MKSVHTVLEICLLTAGPAWSAYLSSEVWPLPAYWLLSHLRFSPLSPSIVRPDSADKKIHREVGLLYKRLQTQCQKSKAKRDQ